MIVHKKEHPDYVMLGIIFIDSIIVSHYDIVSLKEKKLLKEPVELPKLISTFKRISKNYKKKLDNLALLF